MYFRFKWGGNYWKQKNHSIFCNFILLVLIVYYLVDKNNHSYSTSIISYTKNGSYVEYPQIADLKD